MIEWFIEVQAILRSYDSAPRPPSLPPLFCQQSSCFSFSVFLCVAGPANWRERGGSVWPWSQIIRHQKSLALYKSFNTLCPLSSSLLIFLFPCYLKIVQRPSEEIVNVLWMQRKKSHPDSTKNYFFANRESPHYRQACLSLRCPSLYILFYYNRDPLSFPINIRIVFPILELIVNIKGGRGDFLVFSIYVRNSTVNIASYVVPQIPQCRIMHWQPDAVTTRARSHQHSARSPLIVNIIVV